MDGPPTSVVSAALVVEVSTLVEVSVALEVVSSTLVEVSTLVLDSPPALLPGAQILPETSRVLEMSVPWQEVRTHGVAAATINLLLAGSQEQAMSSTLQVVSPAMASWRHGSCDSMLAKVQLISRYHREARTAQAGKSARVTWAEAPAAKTAAKRTVEYFMLTVVLVLNYRKINECLETEKTRVVIYKWIDEVDWSG